MTGRRCRTNATGHANGNARVMVSFANIRCALNVAIGHRWSTTSFPSAMAVNFGNRPIGNRCAHHVTRANHQPKDGNTTTTSTHRHDGDGGSKNRFSLAVHRRRLGGNASMRSDQKGTPVFVGISTQKQHEK